LKSLLRDLRDSSKGVVPAVRARKEFRSIDTYCGFLGHGRSGHSLIGALVNAHPNAVISHELHAFRYVNRHVPRDILYGLIVERDRWFSVKKGANWWGYSYEVPGQWQGRWKTLRVIGDKKGGQTTKLLTDNPHLLQRLRKTVGVPVRFLWVIRNPYDNIATKYRRPVQLPIEEWTRRYFESLKTIEKLIETEFAPGELLILRIEDFIRTPDKGMDAICGFLGLEEQPGYREACVSVVFPEVSRTRDKVTWTPELKKRVQEGIDGSPHLRGYDYERTTPTDN
jgi:hypothetical protein